MQHKELIYFAPMWLSVFVKQIKLFIYKILFLLHNIINLPFKILIEFLNNLLK